MVEATAPTTTQTQKRAIMPDQYLTRVKDAHTSAQLLHGRLATWQEAAINPIIFEKIRENECSVSVDPKGLSRHGWYRIIRRNDGTTIYNAISAWNALDFYTDENWKDVLHVTRGAIKAAKQGRPISLSYKNRFDDDGNGHIVAKDAPNTFAKVAIIKTESAPKTLLQPEKLLRAGATTSTNATPAAVTFGNGNIQLRNISEA
jgi:hypothetical protein